MFKIAALCFLFVQLACGDVQIIKSDVDAPHTIEDCLNPGANPVHLHDQPVSRPGTILKVKEETRRFPATGFYAKPISCITVTNNDDDDDAGYPSIKAGGVGKTYATIHFESQRGKGYKFQVQIFYDNTTAPGLV